jgi:hypothetical protein
MKGIFLAAAASALLLVGCGKAKAPPPPEYNQVTVDLPKLVQTFAGAAPEAQQSVSMVQRNLRYGDYTKALMSLDELANNASITEPQKKVVAEVIEQVKKVINQAAPAAPAAQ